MFLPKTTCNVREVEFARALRLRQSSVEPVVFKVPRVKVGPVAQLHRCHQGRLPRETVLLLFGWPGTCSFPLVLKSPE